MNYVESDCVFTFQDREFESGGAFVSPAYIVAYLGKDNNLLDWHGAKLGTYRTTASWRTPNSYVSSRYYQVEASVDGVVYTGRSAGEGMIYKGKAKKVKNDSR